MTKLTGAALDRAVAHVMGLKSVNNCEKWGEEMTEFNDTERESKVKQEAVRAAVNIKEELTKLIADSYDQGVKDALEVARNAAIEEVAQHIEKMRVFGNDTTSSFAVFIRGMKR